MALNTIADLSVTPASNTDFLGQSTSGTQSVSALDNMIRNHAAIHARAYLDQGGVMTVGGSANAITVTSNSTYQSLTNGLTISFKAASANTGATTLNLDSLGAKAVRRQGDSALSANDILANGTYRVRYDTAYNGAAGAWVLLNPGLPTVVSSLGALANSSGVLTNDGSGGLSWAVTTAITLGTATASTSGTSIDFTGLPSTVKRWTLNFSGVSTTGTSGLILQIGPSGGVETSGYAGTNNAGTAVAWGSSGATVASAAAAAVIHGTITGVLLESSTNTWAITGMTSRTDSAITLITSGSKALAGALSRIRLTTSGGTDTFDAGKVNITYE